MFSGSVLYNFHEKVMNLFYWGSLSLFAIISGEKLKKTVAITKAGFQFCSAVGLLQKYFPFIHLASPSLFQKLAVLNRSVLCNCQRTWPFSDLISVINWPEVVLNIHTFSSPTRFLRSGLFFLGTTAMQSFTKLSVHPDGNGDSPKFMGVCVF